jgi:hypothetical protein
MTSAEILALLDGLRERGVTRASFHPDGGLAQVEFAQVVLVPEGGLAPDDEEPIETAWDRVQRGDVS